jgi:hypothetical protein
VVAEARESDGFQASRAKRESATISAGGCLDGPLLQRLKAVAEGRAVSGAELDAADDVTDEIAGDC